jgi:oxygen-independent coproporphyrinogen-3 oxidase
MPFCKRRCHYCDFNTFAGKEYLIPAYVKALKNEIRIVLQGNVESRIHSIYFGGGTPSLIPLNHYEDLLDLIRKQTPLTNDCEISIESNPGTLTLDYLSGLLELGINRISIGVQSTDSFDLKRLDRIHNVKDILDSIRNARIAGFENINLDLIFGLPWQDLESWNFSLSRAIELNPAHFSLYSLIIEPGTQLYQWHQKGLIAEQDQDLQADMYELAMEMLIKHGYNHYEISNWAKSSINNDYQCRHNLQYWQNHPYYGFGAGAHGYVTGIRTENLTTIPAYIQHLTHPEHIAYPFPSSPATVSMTEVDRATQMKDFMMLGLRLVHEGVSDTRFMADFGVSMKAIFSDEIGDLLRKSLIEWVDDEQDRLRLTKRGVMLGNQVFMAFV